MRFLKTEGCEKAATYYKVSYYRKVGL